MILGRLKRVTSRLSSSDIAQQPASARRPSWLVVERYLKNLIETSPASVCLESSNYSFPDLYLISLCRITNTCILSIFGGRWCVGKEGRKEKAARSLTNVTWSIKPGIKSQKFVNFMQTEAGDFSIKFFRYRSTTSQRGLRALAGC